MAPSHSLSSLRRAISSSPPNPQQGEPWLIIERRLNDGNGNQRGSFTVRGTYKQLFPPDDALIAFHGTNRISGTGPGHPGGDIGTQGVFRFSDFNNPVVIAIVGGTGEFSKARGTVTLDKGQFTYDVT